MFTVDLKLGTDKSVLTKEDFLLIPCSFNAPPLLEIKRALVLPTELESAWISPRNFKFLVYTFSTTVADECLIILTGFGWFIIYY